MAHDGVEGSKYSKLPLLTKVSNLVDFLRRINLPRFTFEVSSDGMYGLVYTVPQVHNVDTGCHGLASFRKNCLCKYSCTSGTYFQNKSEKK